MAAQLLTLCRRYVAVIAADRAFQIIAGLLPFLLAGFAHVISAPHGLSPQVLPNRGAQQLLLVLVVGAALMGAASSVRELVKERAIYLRERAIGLSSVAYLGSKLVVLCLIAVLQGIVLALLGMLGHAPPDAGALFGSGRFEVVVIVAGLAAVSTALGLVISAVVRDENQAMPLLVVLTMAQLVLCGGLGGVTGKAVLEQASWLMPARWGFAAAASSSDLNTMGGPAGAGADHLFDHDAATWLLDLAAMLTLGSMAVLVTGLLIRRLDRNRR